MTIALGVIASDGIVVAADTQVTIPSIWKGDQGKIGATAHFQIGPNTQPRGACIVTGATDRLPYLKNLRVQINREFNATKDITDMAVMEARFGNIIESFHERHVAPYQDLPDVQLLIACERGDEGAMWMTNRGTITPHGEYAAVGAGEPYATTLLGRLWHHTAYDIGSAVALAVFVATVVKASVDGCGKFTNVMYLQDGFVMRVEQGLVNELEQTYENYTTNHEPHVLRQLLGVTIPQEQYPLGLEAELQASIAGVVSKIRASTPVAIKRSRAAQMASQVAQSVPLSPTRGRKRRPASQG